MSNLTPKSFKSVAENPQREEEYAGGRYSNFNYTSSEAKRLLGLLLQDNTQAIQNEPRDTAARKFLASLDLLDNEVGKHDGNIFDERGNVVADVALPRETLPRRNTIMHIFNNGAAQMPFISKTLPAETKKTMNFLAKLSEAVSRREQFSSLTQMLNQVCPGWDKDGSSGPKADFPALSR